MNADFVEEVRKMHEQFASMEYGPLGLAVTAVVNEMVGEYDNNPLIDRYEAEGYRFADANMFGAGGGEGRNTYFHEKQGTMKVVLGICPHVCYS